MQTLEQLLWQQPGLSVFAILDGAANEGLLDVLYGEVQPEFECLYRGELAPDMAEVAPYLVKLQRDSDFARWTYRGWGLHRGIFLQVQQDLSLAELLRHLRHFTMVYGPNNQPLYFRFYDPRALQSILPVCDAAQLKQIFGPIKHFVAEMSGNPSYAWVFHLQQNELLKQCIEIQQG